MPTSFSADKFYNETMAKAFLQFYEHTAQAVWNQFMEATWNYVTNITKKNQEEMVWYHLNPSSSFPCSSQGSWGEGEGKPHLLSPVQSWRKEGIPKVYVKAGCKHWANWWPKKALWARISCFFPSCKYHLLAFKDPGSFLSPS